MLCSIPQNDAGRSMPLMDGTRGTFGVKRVFEAPAHDDGCRVLVDRFAEKYRHELETNNAVATLLELAAERLRVTLINKLSRFLPPAPARVVP
jgi:uncharacterized protein YeaO (DUF488 family)